MIIETMEVESYYDVLENDDHKLLIAIKARVGSPEDPSLLYDGRDRALLRRDNETDIVLSDVHPGVRKTLKAASEVLIAEFVDTSIVREYDVKVLAVPKLEINL